ncbi:MAG: hypothetical protein BGO49_26450 [Planctomycetales bacterium 71-10]|nr:MAG: hypothetical protein BGO49_26450 [Planctomycetales bacterium 71-10]
MGDRNRYSRWRRLPPVFRSGDHKLPGYEDEVHRLTLYLPGSLLDLAQELADRYEVPTMQEFCALLLARSLEEERTRRQMAEVEAKRGPLKGLAAIAGDPGYLAEWHDRHAEHGPGDEAGDVVVPLVQLPAMDDWDGSAPAVADPASPLTIRLETGPRREPVVADASPPEPRALDIAWKHVGPDDGDPSGFLPRLRRGEPVPAAVAVELLDALRALDEENRGAAGLDRRLAYALYRLALEPQVLLTEAYPGAFDEPTVAAIRAVQGMVERILSPEGPEAGGGS